jgi:hypothetical protein
VSPESFVVGKGAYSSFIPLSHYKGLQWPLRHSTVWSTVSTSSKLHMNFIPCLHHLHEMLQLVKNEQQKPWNCKTNSCRLCTGNSVFCTQVQCIWNVMAHAQKPDFVFRWNRRVHLNQRGASVQSTTGSRGVRISSTNAGYTMFRGIVKSTGYPLHSPVSPSLPLPCVTVCHHISTGLYYVTIQPSINE